ncbi:hypothetical protein [Luteimonas saliphila]|uniref:hypothetical protein n=1 Tax=Luteimonas saliphila TaxID=2804919 RepID=UPI00192DBD87|nr:hypothetical protein [Luteimonas saliphila]
MATEIISPPDVALAINVGEELSIPMVKLEQATSVVRLMASLDDSANVQSVCEAATHLHRTLEDVRRDLDVAQERLLEEFGRFKAAREEV